MLSATATLEAIKALHWRFDGPVARQVDDEAAATKIDGSGVATLLAACRQNCEDENRARDDLHCARLVSRLGFVRLLVFYALQFPLDHLALERPDEVDQQLAGQVIILVQQAAREQRLALD